MKGAHRAIQAALLAGRPLVLTGPAQSGGSITSASGWSRTSTSAGAPRRRGRGHREAGAVHERGRAVDAGSLSGAVRNGDRRGVRVRDSGNRLSRGRGDGDRDRRRERDAGGRRGGDRVGAQPAWRSHPTRCRASVAERYDISVTTTGYERVYRRAIAARRSWGSGAGPRLGLWDTGSPLNQRARAEASTPSSREPSTRVRLARGTATGGECCNCSRPIKAAG